MKHRVFLALEIPQSQKNLIEELQAKLVLFAPDIIWEPSEKFHLTLNFLGKTDEEKLNPLVDSHIQIWCNRHPSFSLKFNFLETMYRRHESSFVYLSPQGNLDDLYSLQQDFSQELDKLTLPVQVKFLPHVTIGKLERAEPNMTKQRLEHLSEFEFSPFPAFNVNSVTLFKSYLSRAGSHYQKLKTFFLSRP